MQQRLWKCLYHPNRFVRELGYKLSGDLCSIFAGQPLESWGKELALKLQDGLSENWSQVRINLSMTNNATAACDTLTTNQRQDVQEVKPQCSSKSMWLETVTLIAEQHLHTFVVQNTQHHVEGT